MAKTKGREQQRIADQFNVSRSLVSNIYNGVVHKDIPWPDGFTPIPLSGKGQRKLIPDHDPTDRRVLELESEVVHLKDELNYERRKTKVNAKSNGLFRAIVDEMDQRITPFRRLPMLYNPKKKGRNVEHVVMALSDLHADQIVDPVECGGLEKYNFEIACARAQRYVDKVIEWTQSHLAPNFVFPSLTILSFGDQTSGEIHGGTQRSSFKNQFKNSFAVGQLIALMIRDLAPYFGEVNVVSVPGNHGRRSVKKDHHGAHDNWDYCIAEIARMHCRDLDNVTFVTPNSWSVNVEVNGVYFNVSHGDDIKGWNGVPFYGMARRQKGLTALNAISGGPHIRYFIVGHHHTASSLSDFDGEMIVNGAWVATDAYSYNSFTGYREPAQWLFGVHPDHGITWRLNVKLKSEDEETRPRRYKIKVD